jgi:hypothetical protein
MKKQKSPLSLIALFLTMLLFSSCAHFHDEPTKSVWAGGLWIVFWLPFLGSFFFLYKAYQSSKSGTIEGGSWNDPKIRDVRTKDGKQINIPIWKTGRFFYYFVILQVVSWGICIGVNLSK